jgi:hypothetical protein
MTTSRQHSERNMHSRAYTGMKTRIRSRIRIMTLVIATCLGRMSPLVAPAYRLIIRPCLVDRQNSRLLLAAIEQSSWL